MKKDYKKLLAELYSPRASRPGTVDVPEMGYLMASGRGRPDGEEFQLAAETLYPIAYAAKFIVKARAPEEDFGVMPMEVKWRLDRAKRGSERFAWTMMIMQPDFVDEGIIALAREELARKGVALPLGDRARFERYEAGRCGQILHVGPFGEPMEESFSSLKRWLGSGGYAWEADSHDLYLKDSRRTLPERMLTIIRVRIWDEGGPARVLSDPFDLG